MKALTAIAVVLIGIWAAMKLFSPDPSVDVGPQRVVPPPEMISGYVKVSEDFSNDIAAAKGKPLGASTAAFSAGVPTAAMFREGISNGTLGKIDHRPEVRKFIANFRTGIVYVREHNPERKAWVKEMETEMVKLEQMAARKAP
jgi:hypothetical protein